MVVLDDMVVRLEVAKVHKHLLLAAPIVKVPLPLPLPCTAGPDADENAGFWYHPHPSKRVVIKQISRMWAEALAHVPGGPVGEVQAHHRLQVSGEHPHVMPLTDLMRDDESYYLVMPHAAGGELFGLVVDHVARTGKGLPEPDAKTYFRQMVAGLQHLKRHGLAHGDVSLENVVLARDGGGSGSGYTCRLIDLGLARTTPEPPLRAEWAGRLMGGKWGYVAPEVVTGQVEDWHAADVWSLGLCLYAMLTGMSLYTHPKDEGFKVLASPGGSERLLRHHVLARLVDLSGMAAHLIAAMLASIPAERPTLEDMLLHPWVMEEFDAFCDVDGGEDDEERMSPASP